MVDRRRGRGRRRFLPLWVRRGTASPLGDGLWRGDFERVDRAARRVLQMLARRGLDPDEEYADVVAIVREARETAWQCALAGYRRAPGAASEVPPEDELARAHRSLSRAATAGARVAQAVVIGGGDHEAARRAADALRSRIDEAAAALDLS